MIKKTLACLLIPTFITITNTSTANALSIENNEVLNIDTNDVKEGLTNDNYRKLLKEVESKKQRNEEIQKRVNKRIDNIIERQEKEEQERIEREKYKRTFIVTYYGATYNECGNNHFITASGIPVEQGHIAVPRSIPFGSKIILEGREYIATDTGNPKYICELDDGTLRVDIFVERLLGESDYQYEKRINNMGTKKIVGELYIKE